LNSERRDAVDRSGMLSRRIDLFKILLAGSGFPYDQRFVIRAGDEICRFIPFDVRKKDYSLDDLFVAREEPGDTFTSFFLFNLIS
jgi:hypothetical protein